MQRSQVSIELTADAVRTPIGDLLLVTDRDGILRAADFGDCEPRMRGLLDRRLPHHVLRPGRVSDGVKLAISSYFTGDLAAIDSISIAGSGTRFQEEVWGSLRFIPPGARMTYADLAECLGRPGSARAVGHANGANPICVIVPCHRLVGAGGTLTGYSGGLGRKCWLLEHEAKHAGRH